jgi:hypothetical protein
VNDNLDFKCDLDDTSNGIIDADAVKVILQLQNWHQDGVDQLTQIMNAPEGTTLVLGDTKINDTAQVVMFKAGISIGLQIFGDLPITITEPDQ